MPNRIHTAADSLSPKARECFEVLAARHDRIADVADVAHVCGVSKTTARKRMHELLDAGVATIWSVGRRLVIELVEPEPEPEPEPESEQRCANCGEARVTHGVEFCAACASQLADLGDAQAAIDADADLGDALVADDALDAVLKTLEAAQTAIFARELIARDPGKALVADDALDVVLNALDTHVRELRKAGQAHPIAEARDQYHRAAVRATNLRDELRAYKRTPAAVLDIPTTRKGDSLESEHVLVARTRSGRTFRHAVVMVECDVAKAPACDVLSTSVDDDWMSAATLTEARRIAQRNGWRTLRGGFDICPHCIEHSKGANR